MARAPRAAGFRVYACRKRAGALASPNWDSAPRRHRMSRPSALCLALASLCLAAAALASRGGEGVAGPGRLSAEERAAVRKLAEQALRERDLLKGKTYLTRIEVYADAARKERHAIAIYYRYEGDLGILVHVDV